jgi:hypothetical protein
MSVFWKRIAPYNAKRGLKTGMIVGLVLWAVLFVPVASYVIQPMLDSFNRGITPNQYVYSVASSFNGLFGIIIVGSLLFHLIHGVLLGYIAGRMMDIKAFIFPKTV